MTYAPKGVLLYDYLTDYAVPIRPWWKRWWAALRRRPTYELRQQ